MSDIDFMKTPNGVVYGFQFTDENGKSVPAHVWPCVAKCAAADIGHATEQRSTQLYVVFFVFYKKNKNYRKAIVSL
jgi:hypothetical protein